MLTVHHLAFSRSHRILWLLEELELPYELVTYQRDAKTFLAPPELKAIHPLGKSPVLDDGGQMIAESGAVIEHVLERYGNDRLQPAFGSPDRNDYLYWLHAAEGSVMSPFLLQIYMGRLGEASAPLKPRIDQLIADEMGLIESVLATRENFAGAFSAADIQMIYPIEIAAAPGNLADHAPATAAWLERMRARPAFQRAVERGGPVMPPRKP